MTENEMKLRIAIVLAGLIGAVTWGMHQAKASVPGVPSAVIGGNDGNGVSHVYAIDPDAGALLVEIVGLGITVNLGDAGISITVPGTSYITGGDGGIQVYVDGGHVSIDGTVPITASTPIPVAIVGSDAGAKAQTFSSWSCVNLTCAPSPTVLPIDAGVIAVRISSLLLSNPLTVIGPENAVDAGSGDALFAGVADLTLNANSAASLGCATFQSDGGALISYCQEFP
jgi:FlaG/FlaF family flagellin (archaellin)